MRDTWHCPLPLPPSLCPLPFLTKLEAVDRVLFPSHQSKDFMKFGYTLLYVKNVLATVEFYEKAFGIKRGFIHETSTYAEMDTGETKLGFVAVELAKSNGVTFAEVAKSNKAPGIEIAFITEDVAKAHAHAVSAGAVNVREPAEKPWGQTVSYVRDCNGFLVEICSPLAS